jgi:hypothetical protein
VIDFPAAPVVGQEFDAVGFTYVWNGQGWTVKPLQPDSTADAYNKIESDAKFVDVAGDTMTGPLVLPADPAAPLQAATKQYADTKLSFAGGLLTGFLTLHADPTSPMHAATKQYADTMGGIVVRFKMIAASGTYVPDPKMLFAMIECIGAGGGGGGAAGQANYLNNGGGGGGGGYSRKLATKAEIGASQPIIIGAPGVGAAGYYGTNGGATSVGTLCKANGGAGAPHFAFGGPGANLTGAIGDLTNAGQSGEAGFGNPAVTTNAIVSWSGSGGPGPFGGGAGAVQTNGGQGFNGYSALGWGGGGGCASTYHLASNLTGGTGGQGLVMVTEFCSS